MTLSKVGAMESAEATELLTSTLNGYKYSAEEAMGIVDKVSAIDMAAATSSEELMTALSRTANSADDAGISFDKLLSMIATVSSVTRKSASTIGESFKTIFSRMSNVAAGKDIDDDGESLNDVETTLNKMGIALRSSQKEWRNFEDVLDEVAGKWSDFNSTQQSQIATAIAGTRQQENFRALMNNWDQVNQMMGVAANSTGTATERMGIYLDSVEAKTNNLKAAWEGFIMSLQQSEGFKDMIDWLTDLLEMLENVDWQLVGSIATIGAVITIIVKLISTINTLGVALKTTDKLLKFTSIGKVLTVVSTLITLISTLATVFNSAANNVETKLQDIEERRDALEEEKKSVEELYKSYSELESKSQYYSLTAEEKQKLVDVSKELVDKYGLEAEGVDALTGQYILATDALVQYNEQLERSQRLLDTEEKNALKEDFKKTAKDFESRQKILNTSPFDWVRPQKSMYSGEQRQLSDEEIDKVEQLQNDLVNVLYDDSVWEKDWLGQSHLKKDNLEYVNKTIQTLTEDYGIRLNSLFTDITGTTRESLLESFPEKEDLTTQLQHDVISQQSELQSTIADLAEKATKYLGSEFSSDVSTNISDIMTNAIKEYSYQGGQIGTDFLETYKKDFVNLINADGEDLSKIVDNFLSLQEQAQNGTLKAEDYNEYQQGLRVYLELQKQALKATGMSEDAINEFMQSVENKAISNLNVQLLEMQENMNKSSDFTDKQKSRFNDFSSQLISLNEQFKGGKISVQDYYNQLKQLLNGIDPANIEDITQTFGNLENYLTTIGGVFQDTTKYLDSLWTAFQGGGDSLDFLNNFLPAAQQVQSLTENIIKLDEASSAIDLDTREDNTADIDMSTEDIQREIKTRYDVEVDTEDIDKAKDILNELDGQDVQVYVEEQGADNVEDSFKDVLNYVDDITDGSAKLTDSVGELGSALNDLANLDFNSVDSAFETLSKAFDDLPEGASTLVGTTNEAVQQAAQTMAKWMIDVANSQKEYANIAQQYLIETSNAAGAAITDVSEVNSDIIAKALMTDSANVSDFAASANSIAQAAMSTAVQKLGTVLSAMGNAIANLDVEIPISLDGITEAVKVGPLNIPVEIPDIKTSLKIGGEGTKGLSGIGNALKDFGDTLQTDAVSNVIASQFTPVQANYMPTSQKDNDLGNNSQYSPNSKNNGSGSSGKSDAEKLAEDIQKFREDEGTALEDVTEELINHYKLEKSRLEIQKQNLDYANDLLDSEENTTQWIKLQNQLLTNQRKQIQEVYRTNSKIEQQLSKIQSENPQYDINSWFDEAGNDTLDYINLINSFAQQEREYRATVSLNSEEDIENAEKYIEKLQEQRDYVENLHDSVSQLKEAWLDNGEELQTLFSEMNDTLKEMRDTLLDKFMTALEDRVEEVNQVYQDNIDKLDSLITIQEQYNDVINDTLDTQADLRKELQTNKDSYQYLDDYMRSIIFNEDDYKKLSGQLDDIMSDMNALSDEYQYKINNLTEDEMYQIEEITNEYERQVELKQKEYEILQAQLEVVKARTKLENVRNERTVRMFVNGEWQWVNMIAHII